MSGEHEDAAPGWDAIDGALRPIYGDREPKHYGTILKWMLGGRDPLDGISAYKRTDGSCHWHFVSYGFTELYAKESDDPKVSGYGFELTFRLACRPEDDDPPTWVLSFLQNLARYVFQTGNVFAAGHHMSLNGPIALDQTTDITAVILATNPELPQTDTPHGCVAFVQVVGITNDELEAVQSWNSATFTELLKSRSPLLVTDLARKSILTDPKTAQLVSERTQQDGSSTGELFVSTAQWEFGERTRLTIDVRGASGLVKQMRGRLLHGRPLLLVGKGGKAENVVAFKPDERLAIAIDPEGGYLAVSLPPALAREIENALLPQSGVYAWREVLEIRVVD